MKIQRYFRRKPLRFFSLILLYFTAGSLVFLHAGFIGESGPGGRRRRDNAVASGNPSSLSDARGLGIIRRGFKERTGRRYGPPWMKQASEERQEAARRGRDYTTNWNRALKGRNGKDVDDGRGGSNARFPNGLTPYIQKDFPVTNMEFVSHPNLVQINRNGICCLI